MLIGLGVLKIERVHLVSISFSKIISLLGFARNRIVFLCP